MAVDISEGGMYMKAGMDLSELDKDLASYNKKIEQATDKAAAAGKKVDQAFGGKQLFNYKTALESLTGTINDNEKYLAELVNEQNAHSASLKKGEKVTSEYLAKEAQLGNEIKHITKVLQLQRAEQTAGAGSIDALKAKVDLLRISYKQLSDTEKAGVLGRTIQKEIATTNIELGKAKKEMDEVGKKSTDMGSKVAGGASKAFSFLRTLANIIPGLGIAGLIALISDAIIAMISDLIKGSGALDKFKRSVEITNEALKSSEYTDAKAKVQQLRSELELAKEGLLDKKKVLGEYNDSLGKATGGVKSLGEMEQKLNQSAEAYLEMIKLKTKATIAYRKAAEAGVEAEVELNNYGDYGSAMTRFFKSPAEWFKVGVPKRGENPFQVQIDFIDNKRKTEKTLNELGDDFQKQAAEIAKKYKLNFFDDTEIKDGQSKVQQIYNATKQLKELLDEIAAAPEKYDIQFGSNLESEQQKINKYFDTLKKKVNEWNNDPSHKKLGILMSDDALKKELGNIESARKYALGLADYKDDTNELKTQLEAAEKEYADYEDFKEKYGQDAADRLYAALIKKHKSYADRLRAEKADIEAIGGLNSTQNERLQMVDAALVKQNSAIIKRTRDRVVAQTKAEEDAYNQILKKAKDFYIQSAALQSQYENAKSALIRKNLPTDEYNTQLAAIDKFYEQALKKLNVTFADIFQKITPEFIGNATKQQVVGVIAQIEQIVRSGKMKDATGKMVDVPPDVLMRLKEAQGQIKNLYNDIISINASSTKMGRLAKVVGEVGQSLQEIGQIASYAGKSDVGEVLSTLGQILVNVEDAYTRISAMVVKVQDAMKVAKETGQALEGVLDSKDVVGLIVSLLNLLVSLFGSTARYKQELEQIQRSVAEKNIEIYLSEYKITEQLREQKRLALDNIELTKKRADESRKLAESQKSQIQKEYDELFRKIQGGEYITDRYTKERSWFLGKAKEVVEFGALGSYNVNDILKYLNDNGVRDRNAIMDMINKKAKNGIISKADLESMFDASWMDTMFTKLDESGKKIAVTWEELKRLNASGLLQGETKALFDQLLELEKQGADAEAAWKDAIEQMNELVTGTTSSSIVDSIVEGFKNGYKSAKDFASNFEDLMRQAMLNSLKYKYLEEPIQDFYKKFAESAGSNDQLTEAEIAELRKYYDKIIGDAKTQYENIQKVTGISGVSKDVKQNSLTGAIQSITQEQAGLLVGQFSGMRVAQLQTNTILTNGFETFNRIADRSLNTLIKIEVNTYNTVTELKTLNTKIKSVDNANRAIGL